MSFSGFSAEDSTIEIPNDGFWPVISVGEFQKIYRLPAEYADELLVNHLKLGMVWANGQLRGWKAKQLDAGYSSLAAVPADVQGDALGEETPAKLHYERAVFCYAKALLLPQFSTIVRNRDAVNDAVEAEENHDSFMGKAQQAIAKVQGKSGVNVGLI